MVAAAASIVDELERCPGCGLTPGDAWHVEADLVRCATCEARDRKLEALEGDKASRAGLRAKFFQLTTEAERMTRSAAVKYTRAGAEARKRWREQQPPTS